MTGVLLGLICAALIAATNFTGGLASRKDGSPTVGFVSQIIGIPILCILLFIVPPDHVSIGDIGWGLLAGISQIFALRILWRTMSVGAMGLLGAINAFMGAIVPAIWTATQGSGLGFVGWLGAAVGLTAMALVARKPGDETVLANHRFHALGAAVAGSLFGFGYICLALPDTSSTVAPVLAMRVSASILGGSLLLFGGKPLWISRQSGKLGYLPGLFGCASLIGFVTAVHLDVVALTSVVQALAPLGTAALAYVILKQKLTQIQAAGFGLAVLATVLLAVD